MTFDAHELDILADSIPSGKQTKDEESRQALTEVLHAVVDLKHLPDQFWEDLMSRRETIKSTLNELLQSYTDKLNRSLGPRTHHERLLELAGRNAAPASVESQERRQARTILDLAMRTHQTTRVEARRLADQLVLLQQNLI